MAREKAARSSIILLAVGLGVLTTTSARAGVVFFDDFESDLSQWTGKLGTAHHGRIVGDPVEADHALHFTRLSGAGDIYTTGAFSSPSGKLRLSFDYLGDPALGGIVDNLGGFIGHSVGSAAAHKWLAGTSRSGSADIDLTDDGVWHHYSIDFATSASVRVLLRDFLGSRGVAGDAYFDNVLLESVPDTVLLESVPEPATFSLVAIGIAVAGMVRRSRRIADRR